MREYGMEYREQEVLKKTVCDCCGREIGKQEDFLHLEKTWGYFSRKDGEYHQWDICEDCYDKWVKGFLTGREK